MTPADPTAPDTAAQADLERYARAAALVAGLEIDETWWPAVLRHLGVLIDRAASLEDPVTGFLPEDPAPVFEP